MIRERIGAAVLRSYPHAVRDQRGDEMLGTLLDAGEVSASTFARESMSLLFAVVAERAKANTNNTVAGLVRDTLRLTAVLWVVLSLAGISGDALAYPQGIRGIVLWLLLLWPVLALAILRYDRLAGICGIAWVVSLQTPIALGPYAAFVAGSVVPLLGFGAMIIAPRRQPHDIRELSWLVPTMVISLIHGHGNGLLGFGFCPLAFPALAIISFVGILMLTTDPRLAIAASLLWASVGLMSAAEHLLLNSRGPNSAPVLLLACAPVTVLVTIVHARTRNTRTD